MSGRKCSVEVNEGDKPDSLMAGNYEGEFVGGEVHLPDGDVLSIDELESFIWLCPKPGYIPHHLRPKKAKREDANIWLTAGGESFKFPAGDGFVVVRTARAERSIPFHRILRFGFHDE